MNKLILTVIATLSLANTALAQGEPGVYTLADDAVSLIAIEGDVTNTEVDGFVFPACPPEAMCMPYSKVAIDLGFTLMGCMDDLGPVTYTYERSEDGHKATVYVSAINVVSRMSAHVKCILPKTEQRRIELRMYPGLDEVEVKFLTSASQE